MCGIMEVDITGVYGVGDGEIEMHGLIGNTVD